MIGLLLSIDLSCSDATDIIGRIRNHLDLDVKLKNELILPIKEATPYCSWDAND